MDQIPPAQPLSTPPVAPLPEPKSKVWGWILAGIVLLGVGIISGIFLDKQLYSKPAPQTTPSPMVEVTPSSDPTANWKTYTHSILGYSFSYPESVSIEVYDNSTLVRIDPPDPRTIVGICPRWISFSAVNSSSRAKKTQDKYKCVNDASILEEKIFVESQYYEGNQEILDQILSTFQFTN